MSLSNVYFAVEVQYVHGKRVDLSLLRRDAVPLYHCCFGSGAESQIQEEGCFVIQDAHNRVWFCREIVGSGEQPNEDFVGQFFRMGYLARKLGINEDCMMFYGGAKNEDDLREQLGKKSA